MSHRPGSMILILCCGISTGYLLECHIFAICHIVRDTAGCDVPVGLETSRYITTWKYQLWTHTQWTPQHVKHFLYDPGNLQSTFFCHIDKKRRKECFSYFCLFFNPFTARFTDVSAKQYPELQSEHGVTSFRFRRDCKLCVSDFVVDFLYDSSTPVMNIAV